MEDLYAIVGRTPNRIKEFIESCEFDYRKARRYLRFLVNPSSFESKELFLRSVSEIIDERKLICKEAADVAAWALHDEFQPELITLDFGPKRPPHSVCLYKEENGNYGSIAFDRPSSPSLGSRDSIYKSVESIVNSYNSSKFEIKNSFIDNSFKKLSSDWALFRRELIEDRLFNLPLPRKAM